MGCPPTSGQRFVDLLRRNPPLPLQHLPSFEIGIHLLPIVGFGSSRALGTQREC